ncbi:MAG: signal peptidase I [Acidimicrobiales bacterium]|nr:signal peptidase I [Acidimicrobiales bacterium]
MSPDSPPIAVEAPPPAPVPSLPLPVPSLEDWAVPARSRPARHVRSGRRGWRLFGEWAAVVVVALGLAVVVRAEVAQMFFIPSGSMLPNLQIGDRIVVNKLSYRLGSVQRGDIVVFGRPPLEQSDYQDLVKRVIGMPGDVVSVADGHVDIDGRPLAEPWLPDPPPPTVPSPVPGPFSLQHPYRVPAGEYFVMGDNRTNSEDSRYFGPIPASLIVGKMAFRVWPFGYADAVLLLGVVALVLAAATAAEWRATRRRASRTSRGRRPRGRPMG